MISSRCARDGIEKLAVIGKLADLGNIGDRGSSRVSPPYIITPLQGIRGRAGSIAVSYDSGEDLSLAAAAARDAEAAVVVVGFTARDEGESIPYVKAGGDREDLSLRKQDIALIEAVADANPRCIVVLEAGSAVLTSGWQDRVAAILVAWYPGMEGGNALAAILFGDENPSGKLPLTFPESNEQLPPFDKKAKSVEYGYYHGYRLFDREGYEPAFPFGFGLHYTEYAYSNLRLNAHEIDVRRRAHGEGRYHQHGRDGRLRGGPALRRSCRLRSRPSGEGTEGFHARPYRAG